jgi:hypothetical protein
MAGMGYVKDRWIEAMQPTPQDWERRWIPVSERLPEEGVNVLAWLADRSRAVVAYRRDKWWDGTDEELNFHSYTKVNDAEAPTHWMPLQPPEVK